MFWIQWCLGEVVVHVIEDEYIALLVAELDCSFPGYSDADLICDK